MHKNLYKSSFLTEPVAWQWEGSFSLLQFINEIATTY